MKIDEIQRNKVDEIIKTNDGNINEIFERYTNNNAINNETNQDNNTSQNETLNRIEENYTEEERKAIELVKNKWKEESNIVSFNIVDYEKNIYHISVNDIQTTEVIAWYEVNIESGEVSDY